MSSVRSILAEAAHENLKYHNPLQYKWTEIYGSKAMADYAKSRVVVGDVSFNPSWYQKLRWGGDLMDHPNPDGGMSGPYYFGYATHFDHLVDGVEFDDGTMLICAGIDTFGGTDADNYITNSYFLLTPL
jgi:hypothetical protein